MLRRCLGWPAPHVPPIVLTPGDGPPSDSICPACDAVLLLLDAPRSPRVQRFTDRLATARTLHMEKLR